MELGKTFRECSRELLCQCVEYGFESSIEREQSEQKEGMIRKGY